MNPNELGFIPDGVQDIEMHKKLELFQHNLGKMLDETIENLEVDDPEFADVPFGRCCTR